MVLNLEKKLDNGWSIVLKKNKENYVSKHFESEQKMRNFFKKYLKIIIITYGGVVKTMLYYHKTVLLIIVT